MKFSLLDIEYERGQWLYIGLFGIDCNQSWGAANLFYVGFEPGRFQLDILWLRNPILNWKYRDTGKEENDETLER